MAKGSGAEAPSDRCGLPAAGPLFALVKGRPIRVRLITRTATIAGFLALGSELIRAAGRGVADAFAGAGVEETVAAALGLGAVGAYLWLLVTAVTVLLDALPGRIGRVAAGLAHRWAPPGWAALVRLGWGLALCAGPLVATAPAQADHPPARCQPGPTIDTLPPLDRPTGRPPPSRSRHVVVQPGDTLWSLAADALAATARPADVARTWPRWYSANRDRIGPDPDLILPGQILRAPGSSHGH